MTTRDQIGLAVGAAVGTVLAALYSDDQPRDEHGRWSGGGGGGGGAAIAGPKRGGEGGGAAGPAAEIEPHHLEVSQVEPPAGPHDVGRFIDHVEKTPIYREVDKRMSALAAQLPPGTPVQQWSLHQNTVDGKLTPQRQAIHEEIVDKALNPDAVAAAGERPKAVLLMGPPGSGKTSVAAPLAGELGVKFTNINADDVKAQLPEYKGWNAGALHEESSQIAEHEILGAAMGLRHNLLFDATGTNTGKMMKLADALGSKGYDVHVVNVDLPPHKSAGRVWERFRSNAFNAVPAGHEPGRFVPVNYVVEHTDSKAAVTYQALKTNPNVKSWTSVSNDVPKGDAPKLLDKGQR